MTRNKKAIAVLGPTASGKTSLSIKIASILKTNIISCDSVQIYRYLDIASAKPTPKERSMIKHEMLDAFEPDFRVNVALYKEMAETYITTLLNQNRIPVICGGTGMYFNALYYGLFKDKSYDAAIRKELTERLKKEGNLLLFEELKEKDPVAAETINPNDTRRVIRALETIETTGRRISELKNRNEKLPLDWFLVGLMPDRKVLYETIDRRVDDMLKNGVIDETRRIMEKYGQDAYALGSIGYRHCRDFILGKVQKDEMIRLFKRDTRHYAKRQLTWFRKNKDIHWYDPAQREQIIADIGEFLS